MLTDKVRAYLDHLIEITPAQSNAETVTSLNYLKTQFNPYDTIDRQLHNVLSLYAAAKYMDTEEYQQELIKKAEAAEARRVAKLTTTVPSIVGSYLANLVTASQKALGDEAIVYMDSDKTETSVVVSDDEGSVFSVRYDKENGKLITRSKALSFRHIEDVTGLRGDRPVTKQLIGPSRIHSYLEEMLTKNRVRVD